VSDAKLQDKAQEQSLVEQCKNGDTAAFDRLIRIHQDRIYNLALHLLGDPEDALDLAQEVFLTLFRKIDSFRGESALSTWLYRITANLARNFWSRQERKGYSHTISLDETESPDGDKDLPLQIPDSNPGPRNQAAGRELGAILKEQLKSLSFEHRQILIMRFSEGVSYEEMAHILDSSVGTVKSRLNRAREELRKLMEPYL
jgi:RNA polymerase sigma-70 factor (ECF subfamily)